MPITRRRRANPPDQPENNNHLTDQVESVTDAGHTDPKEGETSTEGQAQMPSASSHPSDTPHPENTPYQPVVPPPATSSSMSNGDRGPRQEYTPIEGGRRTARGELFRRPPQPPPAQPVQQAAATLQPPSHEIKLPMGEKAGDTKGDLLHLAYNPGFTGAEEVRSTLLHKLAQETKHGGRARCWSCGSLAIAYECWNTRNKTFGEIGVAFCEICGVWSVM